MATNNDEAEKLSEEARLKAMAMREIKAITEQAIKSIEGIAKANE